MSPTSLSRSSRLAAGAPTCVWPGGCFNLEDSPAALARTPNFSTPACSREAINRRNRAERVTKCGERSLGELNQEDAVGTPRSRQRLALAIAVAGALVVPATASVAATLPGSQNCQLNPRDHVDIVTKNGHALKGTWRLSPVLTCSSAELRMTFTVVLRHNGKDVSTLSSDGECAS